MGTESTGIAADLDQAPHRVNVLRPARAPKSYNTFELFEINFKEHPQGFEKCFELYLGDDRPWRLPELAFRGNVCDFTDSTLHWAVLVARRYRHANIFVQCGNEGGKERIDELAAYLETIRSENSQQNNPRKIRDASFSHIEILLDKQLSDDHRYDIVYFNIEDHRHRNESEREQWLCDFLNVCSQRLTDSSAGHAAYGYLLISHEELVRVWKDKIIANCRKWNLDICFTDVFDYSGSNKHLPKLMYGIKIFREGKVQITTFLRQARHVISERLSSQLTVSTKTEFEQLRAEINFLFECLFDQFGTLLDRPELRSADRRDAFWVEFTFPSFDGKDEFRAQYLATSKWFRETKDSDESFSGRLEKRIKLLDNAWIKLSGQEKEVSAPICDTSTFFEAINSDDQDRLDPVRSRPAAKESKKETIDVIEARPLMSDISPASSWLPDHRMISYWLNAEEAKIQIRDSEESGTESTTISLDNSIAKPESEGCGGFTLSYADSVGIEGLFSPLFNMAIERSNVESRWARYVCLYFSDSDNLVKRLVENWRQNNSEVRDSFEARNNVQHGPFLAYFRSIRFRNNLSDLSGHIHLLSSIDPIYNHDFERLIRQMTTVFRHVNLAFQDAVSRYHWNRARIRAAIAMVCTRNLAHNVGSHLLVGDDSWFGVNRSGSAADFQNVLTEFDRSAPNDAHELNNLRWKQSFSEWVQSFIRQRSELQAELSSGLEARHGVPILLRELLESIAHPLYLRRMTGHDLNASQPLNIYAEADNHAIAREVYGVSNSDIFSGDSGFSQAIDHLVLVPDSTIGVSAFQMITENVLRNYAKHGDSTQAEVHIRIKSDCETECDESSFGTDKSLKEPTDFNSARTMIEIGCPVEADNLDQANKIAIELNSYLQDPIVSPAGEFSTKYRGLKEMRVAAAYLRSNDLDLLYERREPPQFPRFISVFAKQITDSTGKSRFVMMHRFFLFKRIGALDIVKDIGKLDANQKFLEDRRTKSNCQFNPPNIIACPDIGTIPSVPRAPYLVWRHDVKDEDCDIQDSRLIAGLAEAPFLRSIYHKPNWIHRFGKRILGTSAGSIDDEVSAVLTKWSKELGNLRDTHDFAISKSVSGNQTIYSFENGKIKYVRHPNRSDFELDGESDIESACKQWKQIHLEGYGSLSPIPRILGKLVDPPNGIQQIDFMLPAMVPLVIIDERIQDAMENARDPDLQWRKFVRSGMFVIRRESLDYRALIEGNHSNACSDYINLIRTNCDILIDPVVIIHASIWKMLQLSDQESIRAICSEIVLCSGQGRQEGEFESQDVSKMRRMAFSVVYHHLFEYDEPSKFLLMQAVLSSTP